MRQNEFGGATAEFKKLERLLSRRNLHKFEELLDFFQNTIVYRYLKPLILPVLQDCIEFHTKQIHLIDQHHIFDKKITKATLPFAIECMESIELLQETLTRLNHFSIANRNYQYRSNKVNILFKYYTAFSLESANAESNELKKEMVEVGWKETKSAKKKPDHTEAYSKKNNYPHDILSSFNTLDLDPTEDLQDIKAAWKDLFTVWHPDKHSSENQRRRNKAEKKAKEINYAYDILKQYFHF